MCRPKVGAAVQDWQDAQNLVTGIVFRQRYEFSRGQLISKVTQYLQGSRMSSDQERVISIIDSTLAVCVDKNWLTPVGDKFSPERL